MITPRERFKLTYGKTWPDVVDSAQFQEAVGAAMLAMQLTNSSPPDMATAASFAWRMEGAKQFVTLLMGLADPSTPRKPLVTANLDHQV